MENTPTKPDIPPYFRGDFFPAIQRINASPLNVAKIGLKEIYRFLVEEVTMKEDTAGTQTLRPLRVELIYTANQWDRTWNMARQSKLGPSLTSFLFKLLHQILPTAERVSRILPNQSPNCTRCRGNATAVETLQHAMFDCSENHQVGAVLLQGLRKLIPSINPTKILTLDFEPTEDQIFPITWSIAHFLLSLWHLRAVELIRIRSDTKASCTLLMSHS